MIGPGSAHLPETLVHPFKAATLLIVLGAVPQVASAQRSTPFIPKEVVLEGLSPADATVARVWSLRIGLNVAALQCQFSPYLRTRERYNGILVQHAKELEGARSALDRYYRRNATQNQALGNFDRLNTRLSQSYATFDSMLGFCAAAAEVGRTVSMQPIGKLGLIADEQVKKLRASMTPISDMTLGVQAYAFADRGICMDKRGRQANC